MYLKKRGVKTVYAVTAGDNLKREEMAVCLGADLCFEASGAPQAVVQGFDILRNRGVYLIPGQYSASGGIEIQPQMITFKAMHIIGSSQYSVADVRAYLDFLSAYPGLYPVIRKLCSEYKVEQINEAISDAKSGNNI